MASAFSCISKALGAPQSFIFSLWALPDYLKLGTKAPLGREACSWGALSHAGRHQTEELWLHLSWVSTVSLSYTSCKNTSSGPQSSTAVLAWQDPKVHQPWSPESGWHNYPVWRRVRQCQVRTLRCAQHKHETSRRQKSACETQSIALWVNVALAGTIKLQLLGSARPASQGLACFKMHEPFWFPFAHLSMDDKDDYSVWKNSSTSLLKFFVLQALQGLFWYKVLNTSPSSNMTAVVNGAMQSFFPPFPEALQKGPMVIPKTVFGKTKL